MATTSDTQQSYTQQPSTQQPYTQQPQVAYQPQLSSEIQGPPQGWNNGFWSCFRPLDTCCMGYWCPCILFGKTQQRLVDPQLQQYETVNGNCLTWLGLGCFGLNWVFQMMKREEFRRRFNLEGSTARDCCGAYWCPCFALVQEEKECKARMGGAGHVASQQGYQRNDAMAYNPPR